MTKPVGEMPSTARARSADRASVESGWQLPLPASMSEAMKQELAICFRDE